MKTLKKILKILLLIVLIGVAWYYGTIWYHNYTSDKNAEGNVVKEDIKPEDLGDKNEIKPYVDGELLFLLAGLDQNQGESGEHTRSDTLMLVKLNFNTGETDVISIPRDTRVPVQGQLDKINHAAAYDGLKLTIKTIRDWLNIDLDYYVKVNFESVEKVIDIMGGVDIEVPEIMADWVGVEPGLQKLNGKQALKYVRYRKGYVDGDLGRVHAQQKFIKAFMDEITKAGNIARAPVFIDLFFKEVDTNISYSYIVSKLPSAPKFGSSKLNTYTIPGDGQYVDGISYYLYFEEETMELRDKVLKEYVMDEDYDASKIDN